mgnify:CR=1 FL=1
MFKKSQSGKKLAAAKNADAASHSVPPTPLGQTDDRAAVCSKIASNKRRRPAFTRRDQLLEKGRTALGQVQMLASVVPPDFEKRLRARTAATHAAINSYVEEGKVKQQSALIDTWSALVLVLAEILTALEVRGGPQPPNAAASRHAAVLMSGLFAQEQPALEDLTENFSQWLEKLNAMTDKRRKVVRETQQASATLASHAPSHASSSNAPA